MIENFSKFGRTVPLKNKNAQSIQDCFENILISSKRKPKLIKTDRSEEFYVFQNFLHSNNIKHYSRNSSLGAIFAERLNRTIRDFFKRPDFERGEGNWIDDSSVITKHYNNRLHISTKLTPTQATLKNEGFVYQNLKDKRKKIKTMFQQNDLVRVAELKKKFSKCDTTNWSYKLYKNTEIINDTIRSYKIDNSPKTYNEALLKKTMLFLKEKISVVKKLFLR